MIRKITASDHDSCMALVNQRPAENLFIIGDIEAYGYEQDFQKLWGEFTEDGKLKAVLLKYYGNYIAYADDSFDGKEFAEIMEKDETFSVLSGLKEITSQIIPHLKREMKENRSLYYAKCNDSSKLEGHSLVAEVKQASIEDIPAIVDLHRKTPEFEVSDSQQEGMERGMKKGVARTFFIDQGGRIVSAASTTAENSLSAMVVGVCTLPEYKRKGYASACMIKLCRELLNEGKALCLFYDNPDAGNIYKRLGFEDIGMWMMHTFEKEAKVPG
nr:GNAT family N-acetyltransferase [Thalassobacillus pellis]